MIRGAILVAHLPKGPIGDGNTLLGEKIFHLAETKAEAVVEPDGIADDLGWKAVTVVDGWFGIYRPSLPNAAQLDNDIKTPNKSFQRTANAAAEFHR